MSLSLSRGLVFLLAALSVTASEVGTPSPTPSTVVTCTTAVPNLISNPSFEDGFNGWGYTAGTTGSVVSGDATDGTSHLEANGLQTRVLRIYQYVDNFKAGTRYTATLDWRVKQRNHPRTYVNCRISWYMDSFGSLIGLQNADWTFDWRTFTATFTPTTDGTHYMEIYASCLPIGSLYAIGSIDIDNININSGATTSCSTSTVTPTALPTSFSAVASSVVVTTPPSSGTVATSSPLPSLSLSSSPSSSASSSASSIPFARSTSVVLSSSARLSSSSIALIRPSPVPSAPVFSSIPVFVPSPHSPSASAAASNHASSLSVAASFTPSSGAAKASSTPVSSDFVGLSSRVRSIIRPQLTVSSSTPYIKPTSSFVMVLVPSPSESGSLSVSASASSANVPSLTSSDASLPATSASSVPQISPSGSALPNGAQTTLTYGSQPTGSGSKSSSPQSNSSEQVQSTGTPNAPGQDLAPSATIPQPPYPQFTTSTVLETRTSTITACPSTVTDCPARSKTIYVTTETLVVSTTSCPVTETVPANIPVPTITPVVGHGSGSGNGECTISTVFSTRTATITACPQSMTDCRARSKTTFVTTETLVLSTTFCPVATTTGPPDAIATGLVRDEYGQDASESSSSPNGGGKGVKVNGDSNTATVGSNSPGSNAVSSGLSYSNAGSSSVNSSEYGSSEGYTTTTTIVTCSNGQQTCSESLRQLHTAVITLSPGSEATGTVAASTEGVTLTLVPVMPPKSTAPVSSATGAVTNVQAQGETSIANDSTNTREGGNAASTKVLPFATHSTVATLISATQSSSTITSDVSSAISPVYTGAAALNHLTSVHRVGALFAIFMAVML